MATAHSTDRWDTHPALLKFFSREQRHQMQHDDSVAMTGVCMILLSIVAGGLAIGTIGLLLSL